MSGWHSRGNTRVRPVKLGPRKTSRFAQRVLKHVRSEVLHFVPSGGFRLPEQIGGHYECHILEGHLVELSITNYLMKELEQKEEHRSIHFRHQNHQVCQHL